MIRQLQAKGLTRAPAHLRVRRGATPTVFPPVPVAMKSGEVPKRKCIVKGCDSSAELEGWTLHCLPRNKVRRMHWQLLCRLNEIPTRNTLICQHHFLPFDFFPNGESVFFIIIHLSSFLKVLLLRSYAQCS